MVVFRREEGAVEYDYGVTVVDSRSDFKGRKYRVKSEEEGEMCPARWRLEGEDLFRISSVIKCSKEYSGDLIDVPFKV